MALTKVMIVDDHPNMGVGTKFVVSQMVSQVEVIEEVYATGTEALEGAKLHRPDIILLDFSLPDISGLELTQRLKAMNPKVHVIIFTGSDSIGHYLPRLKMAGISGLVYKSLPPDHLVRVIECVRTGYTVVPIETFQELHTPAPAGPHSLDQRDHEFLQLLSEGKSNSELATTLHCSVKTVEARLSKLYAKLNVYGRSEAVSLYREISRL